MTPELLLVIYTAYWTGLLVTAVFQVVLTFAGVMHSKSDFAVALAGMILWPLFWGVLLHAAYRETRRP